MAKLEKLKTMTDREIQGWLRSINAADLKNAMPGMDDEIRNCILRNMSARANRELRKHLEKAPSVEEKRNIDTSIKRLEEKIQ